MEKGEIAQNELHLFQRCFLSNLYLYINHLIASFQLSSAASLSLGWFKNGVLGNGLISPEERHRVGAVQSSDLSVLSLVFCYRYR